MVGEEKSFTTNYDYLVGSPEAVREGRGNRLILPDDIRILERRLSMENPKGILLPRIVGVYQRTELREDAELREERYEVKFKLEEALRKMPGFDEDRVHPDLIHVLHDPSIPRDVARMLVQDPRKRVAVSSVQTAPLIYEKPSSDFFDLAYQIIRDSFARGHDIKAAMKDNKERLENLEGNLRGYGLTRIEDMLLSLMTLCGSEIARSAHRIKLFQEMMQEEEGQD